MILAVAFVFSIYLLGGVCALAADGWRTLKGHASERHPDPDALTTAAMAFGTLGWTVGLIVAGNPAWVGTAIVALILAGAAALTDPERSRA